GTYDVPHFTAYAHGAAMIVKRQVIEQVGMLHEKFFIYYEELDWSTQIRKAGFKIYYEPKGVIFHKESITMGKESAMKSYYHTRNRILFMRRNASNTEFSLFIIFLLTFIIPKNTISYIINRQFQHLKNFYKGIFWNLYSSKH